jgi:hypothetical protein
VFKNGILKKGLFAIMGLKYHFKNKPFFHHGVWKAGRKQNREVRIFETLFSIDPKAYYRFYTYR